MTRVRAGAAVWIVLLLLVHAARPNVAGADGSGGAHSRVLGRGDIVTSILDPSARSSRPRKGTQPAGCRWITFSDAQLEFLVAMAAGQAVRADDREVIDALLEGVDRDTFGASDLQGLDCGGVISGFRLVDRPEDGDISSWLVRLMITRLPGPVIVTSPPERAPVPPGEPVFVSSAATAWKPIETSLEAGGVVAEVRATPIAMRTFSGEPGAPMRQCDGPGLPYSVADPASPAAQAARPEVCSFEYRAATHHADGSRIAGRPETWIGTVTVLWSVEWRVAPAEWRSLGIVPRTRLIRRDVDQVTTALTSRAAIPTG